MNDIKSSTSTYNFWYAFNCLLPNTIYTYSINGQTEYYYTLGTRMASGEGTEYTYLTNSITHNSYYTFTTPTKLYSWLGLWGNNNT